MSLIKDFYNEVGLPKTVIFVGVMTLGACALGQVALSEVFTNDPNRDSDYPQPTRRLVYMPAVPDKYQGYSRKEFFGEVRYSTIYVAEDGSFMQCSTKIGKKQSHSIEYKCVRYYDLDKK